MVLVILQHSYLNVNTKLIPPLADLLLWGSTCLAAVAFVSISGMMFSYYLYMHSDWRVAYRRYAARAAFLMLAAHPIINLAGLFFRTPDIGSRLYFRSMLEEVILNFPITDTIGLCVLLSPLLILRVKSDLRALAVVVLLVTTPLIVAFVRPAELYLLFLKEALFGALGVPLVFWFPVIPWLAIFLAGSLMGEGLARLKQGALDIPALLRAMNKTGIALAVCGVSLTIGYKILKIAFGTKWDPDLFRAIYPGQTTTLLPGYFAVLVWLFAWLLRWIDMSGHYDRFVWFSSILGRTSLFTFVVQFFVVESVPALLGLKGVLGLNGFLVLFALGLTVMWLLSYSYGRLRGWFRKNDYAECVNAVNSHRLAP